MRRILTTFGKCVLHSLQPSPHSCLQAVRAIKARLPHAPLMAVGFSLGSNILVKYIGEEGERIPLVGAVSVANPFDLQESEAFPCICHEELCRLAAVARWNPQNCLCKVRV